MTIYNSKKHFEKFLNKELIGKYISKGFRDILQDTSYEGIIKYINVYYDDYTAFVNISLKNQLLNKFQYDKLCDDIIIIDKMKSIANKYNL